MTPQTRTNHTAPHGTQEGRPPDAELDAETRPAAATAQNDFQGPEKDASEEAEQATRQALMDTYNG